MNKYEELWHEQVKGIVGLKQLKKEELTVEGSLLEEELSTVEGVRLAEDEEEWEDFELDARMTSLYHTFIGDFSLERGSFQDEIETQVEKIMLTKPSVLKRQGLSSLEAERLSLYAAGHEGAHLIFTNQEMASNYIVDLCVKWDIDYAKFGDLLQLVEDLRVDNAIMKERPGFAELKEAAARAIMRRLMIQSSNRENSFHKALLAGSFGIDLRKNHSDNWAHVDWIKVDKLVNFVHEHIKDVDDSGEAVFFAFELYRGIYGNPPPNLVEDSEDIIGGRPTGKKINRKTDGKRALVERIVETMESPGILDMIDEEKAKKMREDMKKYNRRHEVHLSDLDNLLANEMYLAVDSFGESIISEEERKRMERAYAKDVHSKLPIHVCRGIVSDALSHRRYEALSQQRNLSGQIEELTRRLRDSMLAAVDKEEFTAEYGVLIPNKVWKATKCNTTKIFSRVNETKLGGFAIQLLLDASGSLSLRVDEMRKVAYVLTETISQLEIPLRVEAFCNTSSRQILQRFRDFDDSPEQNYRVTAYDALGDNRDSYAMRIAGNELLRRPEENKVMIVVSDGAPSSVLNTFFLHYGAITHMSYHTGSVHDPGVKHAAIQVRELRRSGVALMGIYTGSPDENTLRAEMNIFGNDFAYVRHSSRLASTVAAYIEQQIKISVNRG
jgi:hypothetical protein